MSLLCAYLLCLGAVGLGQLKIDDIPPATVHWEHPAQQVWDLGPLVAEDLLPVTAHLPREEDPTERVDSLVMLDLGTGQPLWTVPLDNRIVSMACGDGRLIIGTDDMVGALDVVDGRVLWAQPLRGGIDRGGDGTPDWPPTAWMGRGRFSGASIGGGLQLDGDRLFLRVDRDIYRVDAASGEVVWSATWERGLKRPLLPHAGLLLVADGTGLSALDQADGRLVWSTPLTGADRLAVLDDQIYYASGERLYALAPADGRIQWSVNIETSGDLYLAKTGGNLLARLVRRAFLIAPADGKVVWTERTESHGSNCDAESLYYCPAGERHVVRVDAATGATRWSTPPLPDAPRAIVPDGDVLVVVGMSWLAGHSGATGDRLWKWDQPEGGGFIDDNTIFAHGGAVYARSFAWGGARVSRDGAEAMLFRDQFFFARWLQVAGGHLIQHDGHIKTLRAYRLP